VSWLRCQKNCWLRVLGSVVIQLYAGECTPSVDGPYRLQSQFYIYNDELVSLDSYAHVIHRTKNMVSIVKLKDKRKNSDLSNINAQTSGQYITNLQKCRFVDDDFNHVTRFVCANRSVSMKNWSLHLNFANYWVIFG